MQLTFRKAEPEDAESVWEILSQAIRRRKEDGSSQWQSGYPNLKTVHSDIEKGYCYLLSDRQKIVASAALIFNNEPTYQTIDGEWLSNGDFLVVHRVAVSDEVIGKGVATKFFTEIEEFAKENSVFSIKVDTNFDNLPMLKILKKLNYTYCGEVQVSDGPRKAFEKLLN
ncbi:MAG: GNAT family N-acetyltransferase [Moheibacter sp.]